ncbi:hypothetical protein Slin15195_G024330 [Septoria linicola]|uniref:Uncharacterized protein n=1 Tax=Septoria linicola TaxID=215465 RepID=A0A9Q9AGR2_9PEZI|nr:hypothetical protein Slin14017_G023420 [Septoria linicola]USW49114.1 hypothetical protein Slin15195_G024330 [Septoria linicola]
MSADNSDDSGHVIRVSDQIRVPGGHGALSIQEPFAITQYAREMTLARGRILYEVVDHRAILGYVLPSDIISEATLYGRRGGDVHQAWATLSYHERGAHYHAHRKILDQFPSINPIASRIIAERLITHGTYVINANIEKAVVDHAGHMWTSYRFRIEQGHSKESAIKAIKPRLREVLNKWLGPDVNYERVIDLWRKWDLLDAPPPVKDFWGNELVYKEMDSRQKRSSGELETYYTAGAATWYGGKETALNRKAYPRGFS